jgi:hypothetical protein
MTPHPSLFERSFYAQGFSCNHFNRWRFQDDEGVTTFVDAAVKHSGKASLRMESIHKNSYRH